MYFEPTHSKCAVMQATLARSGSPAYTVAVGSRCSQIRWFTNCGIQPMFTLQDNETHTRRLKEYGNVYAKSTLVSSETFAAMCNDLAQDRLVEHFDDVAATGEVVELHTFFFALGVDFVSAYRCGLKAGSVLQRDINVADKHANVVRTLFQLIGPPQAFPGLTHQLGHRGLPDRTLPPIAKQWEPEPWCLAMQDAAAADPECSEEHDGKEDVGTW